MIKLIQGQANVEAVDQVVCSWYIHVLHHITSPSTNMNMAEDTLLLVQRILVLQGSASHAIAKPLENLYLDVVP